MASLFIVGNTNERTFANAILSAHVHDRDIGGVGVRDIFVLHSPESERYLCQRDDWRRHLSDHSILLDAFVSTTIDLRAGDSGCIERIAHRVERFILSLDRRGELYVDLTNGTSIYKNILSNVAYLLGVRRQFVIESAIRDRFMTEDEARKSYMELWDTSILDNIAPAWLTEVRRFNASARTAAKTMVSICGADAARRIGFESDIENAVMAWFRGAKLNDGAALGGAVRHVGRAFEDLVQGVYEVLFSQTAGGKSTKTLNEMLIAICSRLRGHAPHLEPQLLDDIANLLRRLRNASTHERTSPDFGKIRARLSTELLLATSDYLSILHRDGYLSWRIIEQGAKKEIRYDAQGDEGSTYYFGLDGDDTGKELERLFQQNLDADSFSEFSRAVEFAITAVTKEIQESAINGQILFSAGDDILFEGVYHANAIENLRVIYSQLTKGRTCSIGFGRTLKEAYIALKLAKASPGKDTVRGVTILREGEPTIQAN